MKLKKVIAIICVFTIAFSASFFNAYADVGNTKIIIEDTDAVAGDTVDVDVYIENNPGILGAVFSISYDEGITLISSRAGDAFSSLTMTPPGSFTSPCNFAWDGLEISPEEVKDGVILTLTFKIEDNAKAGNIYNISVIGENGDLIDSELNPVPVDFCSGKITINASDTDNSTVFSVKPATGASGASVDVSVLVKNNPGILGAVLTISYDEGLTLTNAASGSAFSKLNMTSPGRFESPCSFVWDGTDIEQQDIVDGIVLTLTFSINSNAESDDVFHIYVSGNNEDIVDDNLKPIDSEFVNGTVTVSHKHNLVSIPGKAATCMKTGLTEGFFCTVCEQIVVPQEPINALGHDYEVVITEANCRDKGYTTYTCSRCKDSYRTDYTNTTDSHEYLETVTREPTCTVEGLKTYRCSICYNTYTEAIEKTTHNYLKSETINPPTVTSKGITRNYCVNCDAYYDESIPEAIPAGATVSVDANNAVLKLKDGQTLTVPEGAISVSNSDNGSYLVVLNNGDSVSVPSNSETKKSIDGQIVVKAKDGEKATVITVPSGSSIVKAGDKYIVKITNNTEVVKKVVSAGQTVMFDKSGAITCNGKHTIVKDDAVPATFKTAGKTAGAHCSVCGAVIKAQKTVAKLGKAKLSKLKTGKKKFKATWKAVKGVDGYQIQYCTSKKFKKRVKGKKQILKKKTIKKQSTKKKTIKKLKSKKTYYVRIRAYKIINNKKIYSKWSAKKKIKVK